VTQPDVLDMTEGSCVAFFRILIAFALRQRISQELYSGVEMLRYEKNALGRACIRL
jgi:hypothetical protein